MSNQIPTPSAGLKEHLDGKDEVEGFTEWRTAAGAKMHPSLAVETAYDQQRAVWTTEIPYRTLEEVLKLYQDSEILQGVDLKNCTWDDVLDNMQAAQDTYNAKGDRNKVRAFLRHGRSIDGTLGPFSQMIPDDNGLSVLRGGLLAMFKMLARREENREMIFRAFEDIPPLFEKAQRARQSFAGEGELQRKCYELYVCLLQEIPELIRLLHHKQRDKWTLFKRIPEEEARAIEMALQRITLVSRSLGASIDALRDKHASQTSRNTTRILREAQAARQTQHDTNLNIKHVSRDLHEMGGGIQLQVERVDDRLRIAGQEVNARLGHFENNVMRAGGEIRDGVSSMGQDLRRSMDAGFEEMREAYRERLQNTVVQSVIPQLVEAIQSGIYHIRIENLYVQDSDGPYRQRSPSPYNNREPFAVTLDQLLDALCVPAQSPTQDLQRVLDQSRSLKEQALGHARWLMNADGFKNWIAAPTSDLILVDGHCGHLGIGKTSPLSVFCASFAAAMTKDCIALHFFCGEHFTSKDALSGPQGLLRSLIFQLLLYPGTQSPTLDFMRDDLYEAIVDQDVLALSHLFRYLIRQIPQGTIVFCIIDNISEMETLGAGDPALRTLIEQFQSVIYDRRPGPTFKLLMSCADKSIEVVEMIDPQQHVSLRAGNIHMRPMELMAFSQDIRDTMTPVNRGMAKPPAEEDAAGPKSRLFLDPPSRTG